MLQRRSYCIVQVTAMYQGQVGSGTIYVIVCTGDIITGKIQQRYQAQEEGAKDYSGQCTGRQSICVEVYRTIFFLLATFCREDKNSFFKMVEHLCIVIIVHAEPNIRRKNP